MYLLRIEMFYIELIFLFNEIGFGVKNYCCLTRKRCVCIVPDFFTYTRMVLMDAFSLCIILNRLFFKLFNNSYTFLFKLWR